MTSTWVHPRGSLERDGWSTVVDSAIDGWSHSGLRVGDLSEGDSLALPAGDVERIVVPLSGSFAVTGELGRVELSGRASVFAGPTDVMYLGAGTAAALTGSGRVAVAEAIASIRHPDRYIGRDRVPVEFRGAGMASRQVHNFGVPGVLDAHRIIACEVITPAGNWSSYPPHKHDAEREGLESELEEIYYFEAAVEGDHPVGGGPAFGYVRAAASDERAIDFLSEVRTGDVALVPYGWHGPCAAPPGYDLYYLNVMAGPGAARAWLIEDHPDHAWVRGTWESETIDSRLPFSRTEPGATR